MRVLVTGAAGFLGSHLTDRLLGEGHIVIGVDNLCTGDRENIAHLAGEPRFRFEERDICQPFDVRARWTTSSTLPLRPARRSISAWGLRPCGLARSASKTLWKSPPAMAPAICTPPPRSVMATRWSIRRRESYWGNVNPVGPRSVYDEAKRFAEAMVMA